MFSRVLSPILEDRRANQAAQKQRKLTPKQQTFKAHFKRRLMWYSLFILALAAGAGAYGWVYIGERWSGFLTGLGAGIGFAILTEWQWRIYVGLSPVPRVDRRDENHHEAA